MPKTMSRYIELGLVLACSGVGWAGINEDLIAAAEHGNLVKVQSLLGRGAGVNAKGRSGSTALIRAAVANHADVVQALIQAGADVNAKNRSGETALMFATAQGYMEIAQGLIAAGADVNAKDSEGETASDLVCRKAEELKKLEGADTSMICPKDAILAALAAASAIERKADNAATTVDHTRSMDMMQRADHPTTNETLRCNTPKHLVIIDLVNGELRYRAWNKPRSVMEKPDMKIDRGGEADCDGTGVCRTCQYSFKNGPTTYTASEAPGCSDGSEAMMYGWLKVERHGKTISSWSCR